jgi:hypothetical protein
VARLRCSLKAIRLGRAHPRIAVAGCVGPDAQHVPRQSRTVRRARWSRSGRYLRGRDLRDASSDDGLVRSFHRAGRRPASGRTQLPTEDWIQKPWHAPLLSAFPLNPLRVGPRVQAESSRHPNHPRSRRLASSPPLKTFSIADSSPSRPTSDRSARSVRLRPICGGSERCRTDLRNRVRISSSRRGPGVRKDVGGSSPPPTQDSSWDDEPSGNLPDYLNRSPVAEQASDQGFRSGIRATKPWRRCDGVARPRGASR